LISQYRSLWAEQVHNAQWFLITEDDLKWTVDHLELTMKGFTELAGTPYVPGLYRYEQRPESVRRYLSDMYVHRASGPTSERPPHINEIVFINQSWYFVPHINFQASTLIPRKILMDSMKDHGWDPLSDLKYEGTRWYPPTKRDQMRALYSCWWFYRRKQTAIPLDKTFGIHHTSNKYATKKCLYGLQPEDEVLNGLHQLTDSASKHFPWYLSRVVKCTCTENHRISFVALESTSCVSSKVQLNNCTVKCVNWNYAPWSPVVICLFVFISIVCFALAVRKRIFSSAVDASNGRRFPHFFA
jgi:hypothetical protein